MSLLNILLFAFLSTGLGLFLNTLALAAHFFLNRFVGNITLGMSFSLPSVLFYQLALLNIAHNLIIISLIM